MHAIPPTIPTASSQPGRCSSALFSVGTLVPRICHTSIPANKASRIIDSKRVILLPNINMTVRMMAASAEHGQSRRSSVRSAASGHKIALTPATTSRLKMFDPTTLPTAISFAPSSAAVTLTASSGADVPNATIVSPMMSGDTPRRRARPDAPETNQSAPLTSRAKPATRQMTAKIGNINTTPFWRVQQKKTFIAHQKHMQ